MQPIGMPLIIMQQVMPGIIMAFMQSQQAWIIFSQFLSPDVQVIMQPMSIISILHIPIIPMLQQQHIMPFIIMQQLIIPPCAIMQRFFIISAAVLSSQVQVILMPPLMRSIFMVQRGAIIMFGIMPGIIPPIMGMFIGFMDPGIIPAIRSDVMVFIAFIMFALLLFQAGHAGRATNTCQFERPPKPLFRLSP